MFELEATLASRNKMIVELQEKLALVIESRDSIQNEYTLQAEQFAQQVQSLQQQLKQVTIVWKYLFNICLPRV